MCAPNNHIVMSGFNEIVTINEHYDHPHYLFAPVSTLLCSCEGREQGVRDDIDDARVPLGGDRLGQNPGIVRLQDVNQTLRYL